jgi:hypothetical protein
MRGLLVVGQVAGSLVLLICAGMFVRKILEEPDITPGARGGHWLPRFGAPPATALVQFTIRTLLRSRQHRLIQSFFLGLAFTIVILYVKTPLAQRSLQDAGANPWRQANVPLLVSSMVMMWFAVIGTRVLFALPIDLRANWIFRMANRRGVPDCLKATRRSLCTLAVLPVCTIWAGVLFQLWPWQQAAAHLIVMGLLGTILVEICLHDFHKIPFTCSYLPGKANVYHLFFAYVLLFVPLLDKLAAWERNALQNPIWLALLIPALMTSVILVRCRTSAQAHAEEAELRFEELEPPAVLELGLRRDGTLPIDPASS